MFLLVDSHQYEKNLTIAQAEGTIQDKLGTMCVLPSCSAHVIGGHTDLEAVLLRCSGRVVEHGVHKCDIIDR